MILLEKVKLIIEGSSEGVIEHNLPRSASLRNSSLQERSDRQGDGALRFVDTWLEDNRGQRVTTVLSGERVTFVAAYEVAPGEQVSNVSAAFGIYSGVNDIKVTDLSNSLSGEFFYGVIPARGQFRCTIERMPLNAGIYTYNLISRSGSGIQDYVLKAGAFDVEAGDYFGSGKTVDPNQGMLLVDQTWKIEPGK